MTSDGRKLRGDRSRATVLTEATRIASRDGLEHLTFGRVAEAAEIAKSSVQVLFADKETLQLATIEAGVAIYFHDVVEPAMERPTPFERVIALIEGWYAFVDARTLPGGCLIHALSNEYRTRTGAIRDRVEAHRVDARARLTQLLSEAKSAGQIAPSSDVEQIAFELGAHQASANVAALMDDAVQFDMARRTSRNRLASIQAG